MNILLYALFFALGLILRVNIKININYNEDNNNLLKPVRLAKKHINKSNDESMQTFLDNINNYAGDETGQREIKD